MKLLSRSLADLLGLIGCNKGGVVMSWNYRIVRYLDGGGFGLHEVYYNKAGEPCYMTKNAVGFASGIDEGSESVVCQLARAIDDAVNKPVLNEPEKWADADVVVDTKGKQQNDG